MAESENKISNAAVILFAKEEGYIKFKHLWHQARIQWIYNVYPDITSYGRLKENFEPPFLPKMNKTFKNELTQ